MIDPEEVERLNRKVQQFSDSMSKAISPDDLAKLQSLGRRLSEASDAQKFDRTYALSDAAVKRLSEAAAAMEKATEYQARLVAPPVVGEVEPALELEAVDLEEVGRLRSEHEHAVVEALQSMVAAVEAMRSDLAGAHENTGEAKRSESRWRVAAIVLAVPSAVLALDRLGVFGWIADLFG